MVLASTRHGQRKVGVESAPRRLQAHGLDVSAAPPCDEACDEAGSATRALEAAPFNAELVGSFCKRLHDAVWAHGASALEMGSVPRILTLGGDHSLAVGSVAASALLAARAAQLPKSPFKSPELVVFWVDAHADINTPSTTTTGNLHGCPASLLTNIAPRDWRSLGRHFSWTCDSSKRLARLRGHSGDSEPPPFVQPARLVYIALRDVDPAEEELLRLHSVLTYRMDDVRQRGGNLAAIVTEALARVDPEGERAIHCSFDIDSLDPVWAPSTGTPVPGGLTVTQGVEAVRALKATSRLLAMDVVEVNPLLGSPDGQARTLEAARRIISAYMD